jgi:creatinine amidohydrolase
MRCTLVAGVLVILVLASPVSAQVDHAPSLPTPTSVFLEDLTWVEVRDAIAAGKTTVIIPTGGTEQNGPFMAIGKHNYLVRYKAGEIARRLGDAIVAPVMAYVPEGEIPGPKPAAGHMRFPGTITTPEDAYEKVLEYAARSLRNSGFLDIALVGDSGGNQTGQQVVAAANGMSQEAIGSHAGSQDTTSLMYVNPGMLRFDKFTLGKANDGQGHVGDPRAATAAIGKLILDAQIEDGVNQIRKLRVSSRQ